MSLITDENAKPGSPRHRMAEGYRAAFRQLHTFKRRVLLVVVPLFIVLGGLLAGICWRIEREINRMESAVWDRPALEEVKSRKEFLQRIAFDGLLPVSVKNRAKGLLGDLAFHQGDFQTAIDYYTPAMNWLDNNPEKMAAMGMKSLIPSALGGFNDFVRGLNDHQTSAPPPQPDDTDLELARATAAPGAGWFAFAGIAPLDEEGQALIRDAFKDPEHGRVSSLCSKYRDRVKSLLRLKAPPTPPDPDGFSAMLPASVWMRLLLLDALRHANAGHAAGATASMEAAFNQAAIFERNPRIVSLIMAKGLREEAAGLLESDAGKFLRPFFRADFCLAESIWEESVRGEYQAFKRLLTTTIPGNEPEAVRLRTKVLIKHANFWREALVKDVPTEMEAFSMALARWCHQNRRYFIRPEGASYADGLRVASESEALIADLVHGIGALNLGSLREDVATLRTREAALAAAPR